MPLEWPQQFRSPPRRLPRANVPISAPKPDPRGLERSDYDSDFGRLIGAAALLALSIGSTSPTLAAPQAVHQTTAPVQDGLDAISTDFIPMGESRAFFRTDSASDYLEIQREEHEITFKSSHPLNPDLKMTELADGRVKVKVKSPIPFTSKTYRGTMRRSDDQLEFLSESGQVALKKTYEKTYEGTATVGRDQSELVFYTLPPNSP
jgi:hypothetical protein